MKKITVLGVTGSIGQQTVDVVVHHRDEFEIVIKTTTEKERKGFRRDYEAIECFPYLCSK